MTIAKEELERQLQDVKVHSEMSAAGAKVKKENLKVRPLAFSAAAPLARSTPP